MREETTEWVNKAEEDYSVAEILRENKKKKNYNSICFHSQQCVEKYLKSLLSENSLEIPYTHDLKYLSKLLKDVCPWVSIYSTSVRILTDYATISRYPGEDADSEEASTAFRLCKEIRQRCQEFLSDEITSIL